MKITIVHGQNHKGTTYQMIHEVLKNIATQNDNITEFFLPKDGPDFCVGCNACFTKGEEYCPSASKVKPIIEAIESADLIMLGSPNYVLQMSGAMKNLLDHFGYRFIVHRPSKDLFGKVAITFSSSAGSPPNKTVKTIGNTLKWMGVAKVYNFPFVSNALTPADLTEKKKKAMQKKAKKISKKALKRSALNKASLRSKLIFLVMRKFQISKNKAFLEKDHEWWINNGWDTSIRPWKQ